MAKSSRTWWTGLAVLSSAVLVASSCAPPPVPVHYRGVPTIDGAHPDGDSSAPDLSADGRYLTFTSSATNLVPGDSTGYSSSDVFVWDTSTDQVRRVPSTGGDPDGASGGSSISADGRYVAFSSFASNLVAGDTNGGLDVFVWDTATDQVRRQPIGADGEESDGSSFVAGISGDGRYVAFSSAASNLVEGDTNDARDVFVWDTATDEIHRQPLGIDGEQPDGESYEAQIARDGRVVAFRSHASNLVGGDINGVTDVFVWDLESGAVLRQPDGVDDQEPDGGSFHPSISDDGGTVVFVSAATNLVSDDVGDNLDVFVWDTATGAVKRQPNGIDGLQQAVPHWWPSISGDGRTVVFTSWATNLTPGRAGAGSMYVWDTQLDTLRRSPNGLDGRQPDGWSTGSTSSANGRVVAFTSAANNLVPNATGDSQGLYKVVLWVR